MRLDELDKEIKKGAKAFAEFYGGPDDDVSLDDAVYEYLEWFDLAQHRRKLKWRRMSAMLCAAGAARDNGLPFTVGHLSGAVWRQREKAEKTGRSPKPLDGKWELFPVNSPAVGGKRSSASPVEIDNSHQTSRNDRDQGKSTGREDVGATRKSISTGAHSKSKARNPLPPQASDKRKNAPSSTGPHGLSEDERRRARAYITRAANMRKDR